MLPVTEPELEPCPMAHRVPHPMASQISTSNTSCVTSTSRTSAPWESRAVKPDAPRVFAKEFSHNTSERHEHRAACDVGVAQQEKTEACVDTCVQQEKRGLRALERPPSLRRSTTAPGFKSVHAGIRSDKWQLPTIADDEKTQKISGTPPKIERNSSSVHVSQTRLMFSRSHSTLEQPKYQPAAKTTTYCVFITNKDYSQELVQLVTKALLPVRGVVSVVVNEWAHQERRKAFAIITARVVFDGGFQSIVNNVLRHNGIACFVLREDALKRYEELISCAEGNESPVDESCSSKACADDARARASDRIMRRANTAIEAGNAARRAVEEIAEEKENTQKEAPWIDLSSMTSRDLPWVGHLPEPVAPTLASPTRGLSPRTCTTKASVAAARVSELESVSTSMVSSRVSTGMKVPETGSCTGMHADEARAHDTVILEDNMVACRNLDTPKAGSSSQDTWRAEEISRNATPVDTSVRTDAPPLTQRSGPAFALSPYSFAVRAPFLKVLESPESSTSSSTTVQTPSNVEIAAESPRADPKSDVTLEQWAFSADGDKCTNEDDDGYLDEFSDGMGRESLLMSFFSQSAATFGFDRARAMSAKYGGMIVPM